MDEVVSLEDDLTPKKAYLDKVAEGRSVLMQLGMHVKGLILQAQKLIESAAEAKQKTDLVSDLAKRMDEVLTAVEEDLDTSGPEMAKVKTGLARLREHLVETSLEAKSGAESLKGVFQVTQEMSEFISHTRRTLLKEAEIMQDLKQIVQSD